LKLNFEERRELLHKTFEQIPGKFVFASFKNAISFDEIEGFMNDSIAEGCEGLMVKTLNQSATYEPSKRSFNWLKLKKDYLDTGIGDSLDLVVVGADYGTGKRTGMFGSFLLACWDEDSEYLQTVCKIGTGFSDEILHKIHEDLSSLVIDKPPSNLKQKETKVDVWVSPQFVWEIKAADLSLSPIYTAALSRVKGDKGIALRFPRFIRFREDKQVDEATTSEQILGYYKQQTSVVHEFNDNDDFDL